MVVKGRLTESISRLIDGDLDPTETEELKAMLETDGALRRELEGMRRVRTSLHSLAAQELPPAKLDALVDPLRMGSPGSLATRPWARWLAAAAVVVLGATIVLEFHRRQPDPVVRGWQKRALEGTNAEPTERFALAPLPTSSVPTEERPLGAADRLVSGPEPEVEADLDSAPALEVMGPLETGENREAMRGARGDLEGGAAATERSVGADGAPAIGKGRSQKSAPAPASGGQPPGTGAAGTAAPEVSTAGAQLFVFMDAETAWVSFEPEGPCEAGRYALRIRVEGGEVREVWPVANPPATTRQVRASQLVLGLHIDNVVDGEYAAEVVIEPRHQPVR